MIMKADFRLTETEKRVLINLHLRGITGHMGSMNKKQRLSLLNGLVSKGYMNSNCALTEKGIKATRPSYNTL